jgi:hypothetical protein
LALKVAAFSMAMRAVVCDLKNREERRKEAVDRVDGGICRDGTEHRQHQHQLMQPLQLLQLLQLLQQILWISGYS